MEYTHVRLLKNMICCCNLGSTCLKLNVVGHHPRGLHFSDPTISLIISHS